MAYRARRVEDLPPEHVTFEPYECFEVLGSGSFGVVYKGCHTNNELAIKVVNLKRLRELNPHFDPDREWGILEKLKHIDHPNLVRFFGMRKEPDRMLLAMEYCRAGDLESYLKTVKVVPEDDARFLAQQIVAGLLKLRSLGIVHRDLKPGNLFVMSLKPRPIVKIGDFGFAKRLGEAEMTETFCGSPLYVAPEILQLASEGEKYDAFKADLWSFGVILYEMVTGSRPFVGASVALQLRTILAHFQHGGIIAPLASVPLQNLLQGLLVLDPAQRLGYEAVAAHPWLELTSYARDTTNGAVGTATAPYADYEEDGLDYLIIKTRRTGEPPPTEESLMATLAEVNKVNREQHLALEEKTERIKLLQNSVRQFEDTTAALTADLDETRAKMLALASAQEEADRRAAAARTDSDFDRLSRDAELARATAQLEIARKELEAMRGEVTSKAMQATVATKELQRHINENATLRAQFDREKAAREAAEARGSDARRLRDEMGQLREDLARARAERDAAVTEASGHAQAASAAAHALQAAQAQGEGLLREAASLRADAARHAVALASQPTRDGLVRLCDALRVPAPPALSESDTLAAALDVIARMRRNITMENFEVGSNVLFFPTQERNQYIAFGGGTHYYLAQESFADLPLMQWYLGCVISQQEVKTGRGPRLTLTCQLVKQGPPPPG